MFLREGVCREALPNTKDLNVEQAHLEIYGVRGDMGFFRMIYWEMKMDVLEIFRCRFGMITDIIVYFVLAAVFLLSDSGAGYTEAYGYENYKAMLLLGYAAWVYASAAISDVADRVSSELANGTFYKKLLSNDTLPAGYDIRRYLFSDIEFVK